MDALGEHSLPSTTSLGHITLMSPKNLFYVYLINSTILVTFFVYYVDFIIRNYIIEILTKS